MLWEYFPVLIIQQISYKLNQLKCYQYFRIVLFYLIPAGNFQFQFIYDQEYVFAIIRLTKKSYLNFSIKFKLNWRIHKKKLSILLFPTLKCFIYIFSGSIEMFEVSEANGVVAPMQWGSSCLGSSCTCWQWAVCIKVGEGGRGKISWPFMSNLVILLKQLTGSFSAWSRWIRCAPQMLHPFLTEICNQNFAPGVQLGWVHCFLQPFCNTVCCYCHTRPWCN